MSAGKKLNRTLQPEEIERLLEGSDKDQTTLKEAPAEQLSATFRVVSRRQQEHVCRNRTEAPGFDRYNPKYEAVRPGVKSVPRYDCPRSSPRKERIFVPWCLEDLQTTYPHHCRTSSAQRTARTAMDFDSFKQIISAKEEPLSCANKSPRKLHLITSFHQQLSRPETKDSPTRKEPQTISSKDSPVLSCNKRTTGVPFAVLTKRKALWSPHPMPEYNPDSEVVKPKVSTTVLDFKKVTSRRAQELRHILKNPPQPDSQALERGWRLTEKHERGLPSMSTTTPRDDLMYRTLEMYMLNVPMRQLATDTPKYLGLEGKLQLQCKQLAD